MPLPHRHPGLSISDIVKDLQEIKTAILRGGLDNLYLSNNGRVGISNKVSVDDALISRPGQPIRVDTDMPDVGGHIFPVVQPFIFPQAMEGLEYMDQVKENRAGVSRYFTGVDQNSLNKTASGQNQLITMAQQRVKLLARIMGLCVEGIASDLHECILKSGHKKEVVKLSNQWTEVDPSAWKKRKDFKTIVGYAAGNKDAMVSRLMLIANMQKEMLAGGIPGVTPENVHETASEIVKASDFPSPDRFFTHPSKIPPPQPPQPDPTVMAAEQMKTQSAERIKSAELKQKDGESERELTLKKYEIDTDAQVKLAVSAQQHEHALKLKEIEGNTAAGLEHVKAHLNPKTKEADAKNSEVKQKDTLIQQFMQSQQMQTQAIGAMFEQVLSAVSALNGPKVIIRDKGGKAIGVKPANGNGSAEQ
jgi:hypothetical protein